MNEMVESVPRYFYLWAKTESSQDTDIHPLIFHLLDVGECTLALWNLALCKQTKGLFSQYLGLNFESAGRQLAFWASLHDLGKAAPGFQKKYPPRIQILEKEGFIFPPDFAINPAPHGILSAWALKELLPLETGMSKIDAKKIALALGGHHGAWPTSDQFSSASLKSSDKGTGLWEDARRNLLSVVKEIYKPLEALKLPAKLEECNAFLTLFSGLVSVADWIGSMSENFPFMGEYLPAKDYSNHAAVLAEATLRKLGWSGWVADGNLIGFFSMFPRLGAPNNIQQAAFDACHALELPVLVILEAPTGIGKTEAALFLADTWLQTQKGHGLYIAMPTQATSNQMYDRVVSFLTNRYPLQAINAHLVHGAAWLEKDEVPTIRCIAQDDKSHEEGIKAETWFLPRKRTLLAPFGIGTVDQALLSVLQTNHFFVRMFGLGQKVIIFDEVHAYDTYMSTLFERLLSWLHSIGSSVILLSATLPQKTRQAFINAWLGVNTPLLSEVGYPRITIASADEARVHSLPAIQSRTIQIDWLEAPEQFDHKEQVNENWIAEILAERLRDGGCAAIICNRVRHAQEIYKAIKEARIVNAEDLVLFHARFPFEWRKEIEDRVLFQFSKGGNRPQKAIVVATQVIEQSLDLDFDFMITDLAPVDLLIQRAGRLHRHSMNDEKRPARLKDPRLVIFRPSMTGGIPNFGLDAWVYDKDILLYTWLLLHARSQIRLPEEITELIEAGYGDYPLEHLSAEFACTLLDAREKARLRREKEINSAKTRLIAWPDDEELLTARNEGLEEDDPRVNEAFRALTRLSEPNVSLICLHQTNAGIALEENGAVGLVDLTRCPSHNESRELLKRSVNVQRREVVDYFLNRIKTPVTWKESAAMRHHYPVVFDSNGEFHPQDADFILKLTRELGLEIIKEAK